jgi:predicted transcriptional regulator
MTVKNLGLTPAQRKVHDRFLAVYGNIEHRLKAKVKLPAHDKTQLSQLIQRYLERNRFWSDDANRLRKIAEVRNVLQHWDDGEQSFPFAVTEKTLEELERIRDRLANPEPVRNHYECTVDVVADTDSLATVVTAAYEKKYSQFPVVVDGVFKGLITESEITRWLGHRARSNGTHIDLTAATVKSVIREKDPFYKGTPIFDFARLDADVEEVMGLFSARPALEVVLLTESGGRRDPIEGIITQWDAARFRK